MDVYILVAHYRNVDESWETGFDVGNVFMTLEEANAGAEKVLRDHIANSTKGITLPKDISVAKLMALAEQEEPEDYPDAIVYWTCELDIVKRKFKSSPKYVRKRIGDKWYHYQVEMTSVSKRISKAEYERKK
jgi:hypothetical protein